MDSTGQTRRGVEADEFFARLTDAPAAVIAEIAAERDGNLAAVIAESRAFQ